MVCEGCEVWRVEGLECEGWRVESEGRGLRGGEVLGWRGFDGRDRGRGFRSGEVYGMARVRSHEEVWNHGSWTWMSWMWWEMAMVVEYDGKGGGASAIDTVASASERPQEIRDEIKRDQKR